MPYPCTLRFPDKVFRTLDMNSLKGYPTLFLNNAYKVDDNIIGTKNRLQRLSLLLSW